MLLDTITVEVHGEPPAESGDIHNPSFSERAHELVLEGIRETVRHTVGQWRDSDAIKLIENYGISVDGDWVAGTGAEEE